MRNRVVEISSNDRYLSRHRGFLKVATGGEEVGRIAIDDIGALVLNAHGLSYSNDLFITMAKANIPIVVCDKNCMPVSWLWPAEANHVQAKRMDAQLICPKPRKKQIWKKIVQKKLIFQADLLKELGFPDAPVRGLVKRVRSGDPDNIEAQAARRYWTLLFGKNFIRDRSAAGTNSQLNYGYTVLRSSVARAVMASGLHPTVSLNHKNKYNAFRLVDDLMEPYRVIVDWKCFQLHDAGSLELNPKTKERLVDSLYQPLLLGLESTSMLHSAYRMCASLAQCFEKDTDNITLPDAIIFNEELQDKYSQWQSIDVDSIDV